MKEKETVFVLQELKSKLFGMHLLHPKYKLSVYDEGLSFKKTGFNANPGTAVFVPEPNDILNQRINTKKLQKPKLRPKTIDELSYFVQAAEEKKKKEEAENKKREVIEKQQEKERTPPPPKEMKKTRTKNVQWGAFSLGPNVSDSGSRRTSHGNPLDENLRRKERLNASNASLSQTSEAAYAELNKMEPCCLERGALKDQRMLLRNERMEGVVRQRIEELGPGNSDSNQKAKTQNVWKKVRFVVKHSTLLT